MVRAGIVVQVVGVTYEGYGFQGQCFRVQSALTG
jgi:hypothetical protein